MIITLTGEESLTVEPSPGELTIEAETRDQSYSPFHMLGSALGACTQSVLQSWASNKNIGFDDLKIDISWKFPEGLHRVESMSVKVAWPSLSPELWPRAIRVARLCGVHQTLTNPIAISVTAAGVESMRPILQASRKLQAPEPGASVSAARFVVSGEHTGEPLGPIIGAPGRPYTVIYDGHCKICGRMVKLLVRWDRNHQLEIIPSQASGARARFPWIPPRAYAESVQVIRNSDGKTWQAAAAMEELLNVMPKGWLLSWLFKIPFIRPFADNFYRWFARNRYRMGCGEHCAVRPTDLDYQDREAVVEGA
jgi:predicted DCC family thiol-disulfide oxidoreductase YuxK/uncharacterized OsmC-like protein